MKLSKLLLFLPLLATSIAFARDINSATGREVVETMSQNAQLNRAIEADESVLVRFSTDPRLRRAPVSYLETLRNGPSMNFLFAEPSGVGEGYSIGDHTARVIDIYQSQKTAYGVSALPTSKGIQSWDRLMLYTLAFHDIGKSIAFRGGDKSRETIYSVPLASDLLAAEGLSREEVQIGTALIDAHQLIGRTMQNELSMNQAIAQIRAHAQAANIQPDLFFALLEIVFVADAGSYPHLQLTIFNKNGGRLNPNGSVFQTLKKNFTN